MATKLPKCDSDEAVYIVTETTVCMVSTSCGAEHAKGLTSRIHDYGSCDQIKLVSFTIHAEEIITKEAE